MMKPKKIFGARRSSSEKKLNCANPTTSINHISKIAAMVIPVLFLSRVAKKRTTSTELKKRIAPMNVSRDVERSNAIISAAAIIPYFSLSNRGRGQLFLHTIEYTPEHLQNNIACILPDCCILLGRAEDNCRLFFPRGTIPRVVIPTLYLCKT